MAHFAVAIGEFVLSKADFRMRPPSASSVLGIRGAVRTPDFAQVIQLVKPQAVARNTAQVPNLEKEGIMESYKITHPGQPYRGPHIGPRLTKQLNTHRWHVLDRNSTRLNSSHLGIS